MGFFSGYDFEAKLLQPAKEVVYSPSTPNSSECWAQIPRCPKHRWTVEEQVILCILERWFVSDEPVGKRLLSYQDIKKIFCAYFGETIYFHGEAKSITANAISAQLAQIKMEGEDNVAWKQVFVDTDFLDALGHWSVTKMELFATASELGITLRRTKKEDKTQLLAEASFCASSTRRRKIPRIWANGVEQLDKYEVDPVQGVRSGNLGLLTPLSPEHARLSCPQVSLLAGKRKRKSHKPTETPHTPSRRGQTLHARRSTAQQSPVTPEGISQRQLSVHSKREIRSVAGTNDVVFRFFDRSSQGTNSPNGFVAGAFVKPQFEDAADLVPDLQTEDYLHPAETHLRRLHEPTPFISVYDSLRPAIHRFLRSDCDDAHLAIIDAHFLQADHHLGRPRALWVRNIAEEMKSRDLYKNMHYFGQTEWMIWGRIPKEAIISTITAQSLKSYVEAHPELEPLLRLQGIQRSENWKQYKDHLSVTAVGIDTSVGTVIGDFLGFIGIPESYFDSMASKVAKVWRLRGINDKKKMEDYLQGVRLGSSRDHVDNETPVVQDALDGLLQDQALSPQEETDDEFAVRRKRIQMILSGWTSESEGTLIGDDEDSDWD